MSDDQNSLPECVIAEMARVRDVILPLYNELGPSGAPAAFMMRQELDAAAKELSEQDTTALLRRLASLRAYT
jgi:hypothetical protein